MQEPAAAAEEHCGEGSGQLQSEVTQRIAVLQENPKKAGSKSHVRYEAYKSATTYDEFIALGSPPLNWGITL